MKKTLILFDVDGTLTKSRLTIEEPMISMIHQLKMLKHLDVGIVGGSNLAKQQEQLGDDVLALFDWTFSENGLMAFKAGKVINETSIVDFLGEQKISQLINTVLEHFSKIELPVKRGNFVEFRNGMINISPIGRSCSQEEREQFFELDQREGIRKKIVRHLQEKLAHLELSYSIGGQISIDVFPKGWDKTYCLQFVDDKYDDIYFFGDKTSKGGNDYEIYSHPRTKAYTVEQPSDTLQYLKDIFIK